MPTSDSIAIDRLLDQIRRRLEASSSVNNDSELLAHFVPPVDPAGDRAAQQAHEVIDQLRRLDVGLPAFQATSRVPGGALLHRVIGRTVRRDTTVLSDRLQLLVQHVADVCEGAVEALLTLDRERESSFEVARRADRQRILDMLDALDQRLERAADAAERADAFTRDHTFRPAFSSIDYGRHFRGERDELLLRYADVADRLSQLGGPTLDLGCGRGELIELIMSKGGTARGVELDPELVEFCRSIFLDVRQLDAHAALEAEADESLSGVAMIQVVEHLTAQQLTETIALAYTKLCEGGVLAMETVNGTSPFVFTRSFFADPTHTNPVHHEYLEFVVRSTGFREVEIQFRSLVDEDDQIPLLESKDDCGNGDLTGGNGLEAAIDERITRINRFLFGAQDYLMYATK